MNTFEFDSKNYLTRLTGTNVQSQNNEYTITATDKQQKKIDALLKRAGLQYTENCHVYTVSADSLKKFEDTCANTPIFIQGAVQGAKDIGEIKQKLDLLIDTANETADNLTLRELQELEDNLKAVSSTYGTKWKIVSFFRSFSNETIEGKSSSALNKIQKAKKQRLKEIKEAKEMFIRGNSSSISAKEYEAMLYSRKKVVIEDILTEYSPKYSGGKKIFCRDLIQKTLEKNRVTKTPYVAVDCVRFLAFQGGVNVNEPFVDGRTPLVQAIKLEDPTMVQCLIDLGATIDARALASAIRNRNPDIVKLLISKGADVNQAEALLGSDTKRLPLSTALIYGASDNKVIKILIDAGAKIEDTRDCTNRTPLFQAVESQNSEIIELLLEKGASVDVLDNYEYTPITVAVDKRDFETAEKLLEKSKNKDMHIQAAKKKNNIEALKLLGADSTDSKDTSRSVGIPPTRTIEIDEQINDKGNTALHRAALDGDIEGFIKLMDSGADCLLPNHSGMRPIDLFDHHGNTILHYAALSGKHELMKKLIDMGAKIDAVNAKGETPLYFASGYEETQQILTENGAVRLNDPAKDPEKDPEKVLLFLRANQEFCPNHPGEVRNILKELQTIDLLEMGISADAWKTYEVLVDQYDDKSMLNKNLVTINFGGEEPIRVSKGRLALMSDVFRTMFSAKMKESASSEMLLEIPEGEARGVILDYLQGKDTQVTAETVAEILQFADQYQIKELEKKALHFIEKNISEESVDDLAELARHLQSEQLEKICNLFKIKTYIDGLATLPLKEINDEFMQEMMIILFNIEKFESLPELRTSANVTLLNQQGNVHIKPSDMTSPIMRGKMESGLAFYALKVVNRNGEEKVVVVNEAGYPCKWGQTVRDQHGMFIEAYGSGFTKDSISILRDLARLAQGDDVDGWKVAK